jgi:hypothetical protein
LLGRFWGKGKLALSVFGVGPLGSGGADETLALGIALELVLGASEGVGGALLAGALALTLGSAGETLVFITGMAGATTGTEVDAGTSVCSTSPPGREQPKTGASSADNSTDVERAIAGRK